MLYTKLLYVEIRLFCGREFLWRFMRSYKDFIKSQLLFNICNFVWWCTVGLITVCWASEGYQAAVSLNICLFLVWLLDHICRYLEYIEKRKKVNEKNKTDYR